MGKKEKIVYRANKKLLKRLLWIFLTAIIIAALYKPVKIGIEYIYYNTWKSYDMTSYNLKIKLPRAYIKEVEDDTSIFNSSTFITDTDIKVNQEYVNQKPETIFKGRNIFNGISMSIEYLNTEKTTRTLDEIAENYYTLIRIYYDDKYEIGEYKKDYINLLDTDAVRVEVDMLVETRLLTFVTYLVPTDTREITVTFLGDADQIDKNIDNIEKIVSKME